MLCQGGAEARGAVVGVHDPPMGWSAYGQTMTVPWLSADAVALAATEEAAELAARQGEIEGLRRALTLPGADEPGLRAKIRAEKDRCKALRKEVPTGVHVRILHLLASSFGISAEERKRQRNR